MPTGRSGESGAFGVLVGLGFNAGERVALFPGFDDARDCPFSLPGS